MSDYGSSDAFLSRYFEGFIQPDELLQLERRLMEDDEFARRVAKFCLIHHQIGELLTEDQLHEIMDQFATRSPLLRQELFNRALQSKPGATKDIGRARPFGGLTRIRALSLAAAILIV